MQKEQHIFTVWQHDIISDTPVPKERVIMFSGWLVEAYYLRNISPVITYTTFHYSSEIHGKNQWNSTRKDNLIIHNSYKNRTTIRWNRSSGFKAISASQYYKERVKLSRNTLLSLAD